jgi:thioredoxin reductase
MGLISNAFKQGSWAVKHAAQNLRNNGQADVDILIVGAGPAGLAASLQATEIKSNYLTIEQNAFGGTIYNFPRKKLVMTRPAALPIFGQIKFPGAKVSKEQLLAAWNQMRMKAGLRIQERTKFESLDVRHGIFEVKTSLGLVRARKVILAIGVGGTPRKLGIPNEDSPKVAYRLIDPADYKKNHIAVVGGGNSALEAAEMLAESKYQNQVVLIVRKDMSKANDVNQAKVRSLEAKGRLKIILNSEVKEIQPNYIVVSFNGNQLVQIPNQFVFIFAGAEMPWQFLTGLGVAIDKKFGEALKKSS